MGGSPVLHVTGTLLLSLSEPFVSLRALWARKALGGGMRQAGVIAAPMLVALKEIVPLLKDDHVRARKIAQGLFTVPEVIFFLTAVLVWLFLLPI